MDTSDTDFMVDGLVQTTGELTSLISNPQERQQYEASLRVLCTDQWADVKNQLNQVSVFERSLCKMAHSVGHVNNIPRMQFFIGISRNTQNQMLSLTDCVWNFQNNALWDTH